VHRRAFLGAVGLATLAGCAGGNGGGDATATAPSSSPASEATTPRPSATPTPADSVPPPPHLGVSLSPQSYEAADFTRFVDRATAAGTALRWAGDWAQLADASGAPAVVTSLAHERGLAAVVDTGVFSASNRALFRPLTAANQRAFVDAVSGFAAEHRPEYLGFGVEVNLHRESDPASFATYVDLFAAARAAVADAAPATRVSVTFQYERLQGLRGGLFGGENDPSTAEWDLLDAFPDADLVGLTTYPGLVFHDPGDVPDGYVDAVASRTDAPIAITETGWSAETVAPGWDSDEATQAAYVRRLFDLVAPVSPELLLWVWVYDQPTDVAAFEGMGLRRADDTARPAWDAWVAGAP